jgi:tripartite-type tricarboxylate transporter receptor subunit TctC
MNRRQILGAALASLSAALPASRAAFGQTKYPDRPIRLLVPFGAGGVVDAVAREWAERMKGPLGTIVIENQGGAGGTIATGEAARAAPDGYTLLFGNTSTLVLNPAIMPKVPYDPAKDFVPVSILAVSASGIIVHPSVPAKTLKEFIAYAKENQSKLSYGSAGAGTMTNLAGELFKQLIGAPAIVHVPYKGAGPSLTDIVSGAIPMATINVTGQVLSLHNAGKVRILAVTSPRRLKGAPDIPTAIEAGMPGMQAELFTALLVQAKTPKPIMDQIYNASRKVMSDPAMHQALIRQGLEPIADSNPEKATKYVHDELTRWTPLIEKLGLKQQK